MNEDSTSNSIKVEPRIMQVLQILIENSPNVVSREQLISEVWDNYGGADDALNQSISHLRKILNDTNKEKRIIETVVKKGYRFLNDIHTAGNEKKIENKHTKKSLIWIAIIALILISGAIVLYMFSNNEPSAPSIPKNPDSNQESIHLAPERKE